MSDLEYISTICAFIAGVMILVQLFLMRHRIKKRIRLRLIQAKANIHNMTKLSQPEKDIWSDAAGQKRDFR